MKGTEFKTTTIVVFSVYSLSNYGLNYNIFMRVSYTLSVFVTLTFHLLPGLLLSFLFSNTLHRELFQYADDYGIRDS